MRVRFFEDKVGRGLLATLCALGGLGSLASAFDLAGGERVVAVAGGVLLLALGGYALRLALAARTERREIAGASDAAPEVARSRWYVADREHGRYVSRAERWLCGGGDVIGALLLLALAALEWDGRPGRAYLCVMGAVVLAIGAVRGFRVEVRVDRDIVLDRGYLWTRRIVLNDIQDVHLERDARSGEATVRVELPGGRRSPLLGLGFLARGRGQGALCAQVAEHIRDVLPR